MFPDGHPYQATLRGLTIGEDTPFTWGLGARIFDSAPYRRVLTAVGGGYGVRSPGPDLPGERTLIWPLQVRGQPEWTEAKIDELKAAWHPILASEGDTLPLLLQTRNRRTILYGKPDAVQVDPADHGFVSRPTVTFLATDPRAYAELPVETVLPIEIASGGQDFPHAFPHGFGSITPGTTALVNAGNTATPISVVLAPTGVPLVDPKIVLDGVRLEFGLTVPLGRYLAVDTNAKSARLRTSPNETAGEVNVSYTVDRTLDSWGWPWLPPGSSVIQTLGSGSGTGTVSVRSAWL